MSGQLIELIIFAAIAFFIINKLIATLGTTSEDTNGKSFFGESGSIKDVTHTGKVAKVSRPNFMKKQKISLKGLVVAENEKEIESGITAVLEKLPAFKPDSFIKGAKMAFQMIISAGVENNAKELDELVDKRYLEHFNSVAASYGKITEKKSSLTAHISEIYLFGNNIFIKILFAGKDVTSKLKDLREEWTFTKSSLSSGHDWYLSNIDKL